MNAHREGLARLQRAHAAPPQARSMPDMLALDADYRERFGGVRLLPLTLRIVIPALLALAVADLSIALLVARPGAEAASRVHAGRVLPAWRPDLWADSVAAASLAATRPVRMQCALPGSAEAVILASETRLAGRQSHQRANPPTEAAFVVLVPAAPRRRRPVLSDYPVFPILLATDLDASRAFYHGVLGLEILREDEGDRIVFRCGAGTQLAVTLSTVGTSDSQTQLAWRVPDIREAVTDLRARGVRVEEYTAPDPVTDDGVADMGHSWAAWFIDPSRNVLAVVQPKP